MIEALLIGGWMAYVYPEDYCWPRPYAERESLFECQVTPVPWDEKEKKDGGFQHTPEPREQEEEVDDC